MNDAIDHCNESLCCNFAGDVDGNIPQLMKLNEDWDQVYRRATLGLQSRLEALELENNAIKQLNSQLLLKVEQQQVNKANI